MNTTNKSREELEAEVNQLRAELNFLRDSKKAGNVASVVNTLIKWTGLTAIVYFAIYKSIEVLAGKITKADIGISVLTSIFGYTKAISYIALILLVLICFVSVIYGIKQRTLRLETVERLQTRIQDLEIGIDPRRSTSALTPRGETRPEDQ